MLTARSTVAALLFLSICFSFVGCDEGGTQEGASPATQEIGFGSFEGLVYTNEFFGLSVTAPEGWFIQDRQGQLAGMEMGGEMIAGDDENLRAAMKAGKINTVPLFAVYEHPVGTSVPFNASVQGVAERISHAPGIQRGRDYLAHVRKGLQAGQMSITFEDGYQTAKLGGRSFDVLRMTTHLGNLNISQEYYAIVHKGYALGFVLSYIGQEQQAKAMSMLDSITMD
jgi:hypothetical protein